MKTRLDIIRPSKIKIQLYSEKPLRMFEKGDRVSIRLYLQNQKKQNV